MWNGRVMFGDGWVDYLGATDQNTAHAHSATQLAFGLHAELCIEWARGTTEANRVLIPAGIRHVVQCNHEQVRFIYLAPHNALNRAMLTRFDATSVIALDAEILTSVSASSDFSVIEPTLLSLFAPVPEIVLALTSALKHLRDDMNGPGAISRAAVGVGLSESRLRALVKEQLGVPLSQWLLWRKLERSASAIVSGASLSAAAADGGFADQAHLARTMRRMFGITTRTAARPLRTHKRFVQD